MKTELDIRREPKRVGKLGWFDVKNINRNIPAT